MSAAHLVRAPSTGPRHARARCAGWLLAAGLCCGLAACGDDETASGPTTTVGAGAAGAGGTSSGGTSAGGAGGHAVGGPAYPRLMVWYPDTEDQEDYENAAKFDIIVDGYWYTTPDDIVAIRELNPAVKLVPYVSPGQVAIHYTEHDPENNEQGGLASYSAQFFLTQVGTTLSADLGPLGTDTVLHVSDTMLAGQPLFVTANGSDHGSVIVCEEELMVVTAVDHDLKTLTVVRGIAKDHVTHGSGTRVASLVQTWHAEGEWDHEFYDLDISTNCPEVDGRRWVDLIVERNLTRFTALPYDGVFNDIMGGYYFSTYYDGQPSGTLDCLRNNEVADYHGPSCDGAWNAGILAYAQRMRAGMGQDAIYLANFPYEGAGDIVNGGLARENWSFMVGVHGFQANLTGPCLTLPKNSYFEMLDNVTAEPDYSWIHQQIDSPTDYQKARFGLCSALMGDGVSAIGSTDDGTPIWRDEYDKGTAHELRWLGRPLGPAYPIETPGATNLLTASEMDSELDVGSWAVEGDYAEVVYDAVENAARLSVSEAGTIDSAALHKEVPLLADPPYTLSYDVKASSFSTQWQRIDPYIGASEYFVHFNFIPDEWTHYSTSAVHSGSAGTGIRIYFGAEAGTRWIKNVELRTGSRLAWRRDYEHGSAFVNGAKEGVLTVAHPQTLLGVHFSRIDGTQAPMINDGTEVVGDVELPALDGIVLVGDNG